MQDLQLPVRVVLEMALRVLHGLREKQRVVGLDPEEEDRLARMGRLVLEATRTLLEVRNSVESELTPEALGLTEEDAGMLLRMVEEVGVG